MSNVRKIETVVPYEENVFGGKYAIEGTGNLHVYDSFIMLELFGRGRVTSDAPAILHEILLKKEITDKEIEGLVQNSSPLCVCEPCIDKACLYRTAGK